MSERFLSEVGRWGSVPDSQDESCRLYLEATEPDMLRVVIVRAGEAEAGAA